MAPVKDWSTATLKEWHANAPVPYCWIYDSVPGADDGMGNSRCSCPLCGFASLRDLPLSFSLHMQLADLYAEIEQVRGDSFRAN
ncbi:hypothetical protein ACFV5G_42315 [Streptomyces sp. NPDC059766]|uniref:hypothetical protein n=1 Tax=Streptomyces sp. NPDC059766 TaxID=3346940 RepID=UPI0036494DC5